MKMDGSGAFAEADGMTMMVVTHELGFARRVATRVIFMDNAQRVCWAKEG
jgi:ABC-type polar amino acid transport system ATPase subunit